MRYLIRGSKVEFGTVRSEPEIERSKYLYLYQRDGNATVAIVLREVKRHAGLGRRQEVSSMPN